MTDGFLRFVEAVVNKIKRPTVSKKSRVRLINFKPLKALYHFIFLFSIDSVKFLLSHF